MPIPSPRPSTIHTPATWPLAFSCGLSAKAVSGPGGGFRLPTVRQVEVREVRSVRTDQRSHRTS
eukprot:1819352-Prymnesium_polylepis.2